MGGILTWQEQVRVEHLSLVKVLDWNWGVVEGVTKWRLERNRIIAVKFARLRTKWSGRDKEC
ncbi:MAG: hypothetical protein KJ597_05115 [Nanoarchaeota archaeon]|nr:hypothetical protein [Nanoarchaeota archaeon]